MLLLDWATRSPFDLDLNFFVRYNTLSIGRTPQSRLPYFDFVLKFGISVAFVISVVLLSA
jgi:hypothetical protein